MTVTKSAPQDRQQHLRDADPALRSPDTRGALPRFPETPSLCQYVEGRKARSVGVSCSHSELPTLQTRPWGQNSHWLVGSLPRAPPEALPTPFLRLCLSPTPGSQQKSRNRSVNKNSLLLGRPGTRLRFTAFPPEAGSGANVGSSPCERH